MLSAGTSPAATPAPANAPADVRADARPPPAAERVPLAPVGELREMADAERQEALAARYAADLLRANYEKAHGPDRGKAAGGAGTGENLAFAGVGTAYRHAIDRCPGTELECYCRVRTTRECRFCKLFWIELDLRKVTVLSPHTLRDWQW